ncbi:hypothetical protein ThidrDRAFT_4652, partial [Thiorhodococcus drewsii AZ1]
QAAQSDPRRGRHWHLARLYLGPTGGGALAGKGLPKRRLASETCADQFLDSERGEVPVARRAEFVGRRRQIQSVLRAFRDGSPGVLVQGMGSLGKSSLSARIASRLTGHRTVVIFGDYDALTILDRLLEAVPVQQRQVARDTWREAVLADPGALTEALEDLLEGPLDADPVLLVVDDLESVLETPAPSAPLTPVQPDYRVPLAAVLTAFARASTASRLLLTSRYRFTLSDSRGRDLAEALDPVPLRPMDGLERRKQLGATARTAKTAEPTTARWLFDTEQDARRAQAEVLRPSLERLDAYGAEPSHGLLLIAVDCAELIGDIKAEEYALKRLLRISSPGYERGSALLRLAAKSKRMGALDSALEAYSSAVAEFVSGASDRDIAIAQGGIADILHASGNLDEALRIRIAEQLPVYERLGDVHSKAVTMGRIADIL